MLIQYSEHFSALRQYHPNASTKAGNILELIQNSVSEILAGYHQFKSNNFHITVEITKSKLKDIQQLTMTQFETTSVEVIS